MLESGASVGVVWMNEMMITDRRMAAAEMAQKLCDAGSIPNWKFQFNWGGFLANCSEASTPIEADRHLVYTRTWIA